MPRKRRGRKNFGAKDRGTHDATQICDARVAPQNIRFPQDTSLLNEVRTKLEKMIDWFCSEYGLEKPHTYRKVAHKEYLVFAKSKKPSVDRIKQTIRHQLGYVRRNLKYVDGFLQQGYKFNKKYLDDLETIHKVYEQQKYMLGNNTHKVADRIVSISQPYVRPVVRGKASKSTEFSAKIHLSIDEWGFARIEYLSFDACNEGPMLIQALEAYKYHHDCYPVRVLMDQIYRTKFNIAFCQKNGIHISGPKLGGPIKNEALRKTQRPQLRIMRIEFRSNVTSVLQSGGTEWG